LLAVVAGLLPGDEPGAGRGRWPWSLACCPVTSPALACCPVTSPACWPWSLENVFDFPLL